MLDPICATSLAWLCATAGSSSSVVMQSHAAQTRQPLFVRLAFRTAVLLLALAVMTQVPAADAADPAIPDALIGYTDFRTNLPGGRHANVVTMRAHTVHANGTGQQPIAAELAEKPSTWTQFAGWSPDGTEAVVGLGWEHPDNARWEEQHRQFRFNSEGWLLDQYLVSVPQGRAVNLTAVERVSFYNSGLFFWPGDPSRLGFQALVDGVSHPFRMDRDGRNKLDLTEGSRGFAYGFGASPDGRRISYHKDYQVYIADADGSNVVHVETGHPFNFVPQWSPDGKRLLFLSGEHYDCHPHLVESDGTGLRKIADRNGYRGVVEFLDVPDFHGGSSDVPVWSSDGRSIFYTARVAESVELFQYFLGGTSERLTDSPPGSLNYHPTAGPDSEWIIFGSNRSGTRQLYVMHTRTRTRHAITHVKPGRGAMWPHWQPK